MIDWSKRKTAAQIAADRRAAMSVTRFQARAALLQAGLLSSVEAMVAAADEMTQIAWEDAQVFERNSPTIVSLAALLDPPLDDDDLDDLFAAAALLSA